MSVLIDGMEMPEKGKCISITIFDDGSVCRAGGSELLGTAIPVPSHGRLIDADVLEEELGRFCYDSWVYNALHHAPTIIPAEEGADD